MDWGKNNMKYKIILICSIVMLIMCACNNSINSNQPQIEDQIETDVPSPENSLEPTSSPSEDIYAKLCEEMQPWQIEEMTKINVSHRDAESYLQEKGLMNECLESKFGKDASSMQESDAQEQIVDNFHRVWNDILQRRDNMFALMTEDYNEISYTLVVTLSVNNYSLSLVMSDSSNNIIHWVGTELPQSAGFLANVVEWPECTALFGFINQERLGGPNYDEILPIDFSKIEVSKENNEVLSQTVSGPGVVLLFFDAGTKISNYQILNKEGQIVEALPINYLTFDENGVLN